MKLSVTETAEDPFQLLASTTFIVFVYVCCDN